MNRYKAVVEAIVQAATKHDPAKPFNIMEIGVHQGERSREMLREANRHGRHRVHFFAFDLFEEWNPEKNAAEYGKPAPPLKSQSYRQLLFGFANLKHLRICRGDSAIMLPQIIAELPKMHVIFVDGGHSLETINSDLTHALTLLDTGGVMILDDYYPDKLDVGCRAAVESFAARRPEFVFEALPRIDRFDELQVACVKVTHRGGPGP